MKLPLKKVFNHILHLLVKLRDWWREQEKDDVMYVQYDLTTDTLTAYDWVSEAISPFSGKFSSKKFQSMSGWCSKRTCIYIWAGMDKKYLAYHEPIKDYLADESLLRTGQGYHHGSGKRYGETKKVKCPTCGKFQ